MIKLLKFYTPNCSACKDMSRHLETIKKFGINLLIAEIDCTEERNAELVAKYEITSVPTLVKVDTGEKLIGYTPSSLKEFLRISITA